MAPNRLCTFTFDAAMFFSPVRTGVCRGVWLRLYYNKCWESRCLGGFLMSRGYGVASV